MSFSLSCVAHSLSLPLADLSSAFGLLVQWPEDPQEKLLVFRLENEDTSSRSEVIQHLAKLTAEAHFSTDSVSGAADL